MKDSIEKGKVMSMPSPHENYSIINGGNTKILLKDDKVANPIEWIKSLSSEFSNMLMGDCDVKNITDIFVDLDKSPSTIDVYQAYQIDDVVELLNEFSDIEPFVRVFGSQTVVRYNIESLLIRDVSGEVIDVTTLAYGINLNVSEEEEYDDEILYDDDFEDDTVEREDLIISGNDDIHKKIANDVASIVSDKQKAYGNSVDKVERVIEVLMEQYDNGDGTYTIPKELIPHLLYQVRILDKQNRIFTNPKGDLMDESPYTDILGYALLMLGKLK